MSLEGDDPPHDLEDEFPNPDQFADQVYGAERKDAQGKPILRSPSQGAIFPTADPLAPPVLFELKPGESRKFTSEEQEKYFSEVWDRFNKEVSEDGFRFGKKAKLGVDALGRADDSRLISQKVHYTELLELLRLTPENLDRVLEHYFNEKSVIELRQKYEEHLRKTLKYRSYGSKDDRTPRVGFNYGSWESVGFRNGFEIEGDTEWFENWEKYFEEKDQEAGQSVSQLPEPPVPEPIEFQTSRQDLFELKPGEVREFTQKEEHDYFQEIQADFQDAVKQKGYQEGSKVRLGQIKIRGREIAYDETLASVERIDFLSKLILQRVHPPNVGYILNHYFEQKDAAELEDLLEKRMMHTLDLRSFDADGNPIDPLIVSRDPDGKWSESVLGGGFKVSGGIEWLEHWDKYLREKYAPKPDELTGLEAEPVQDAAADVLLESKEEAKVTPAEAIASLKDILLDKLKTQGRTISPEEINQVIECVQVIKEGDRPAPDTQLLLRSVGNKERENRLGISDAIGVRLREAFVAKDAKAVMDNIFLGEMLGMDEIPEFKTLFGNLRARFGS